MAGFPVIGLGAVFPQLGVRGEKAGGFHVGHEGGAGIEARQVARHDDADLVGKDFLALVIDHAAAVAVTVEAEREVGPGGAHGVGHVVQHFHRFGVRVVVGEGVIQLVVAGHHLDADTLEKLGREGRGRAVAGGADHAQLARHPEVAHEVVEIGLAHAIDEFIRAAVARFALTVQHDVAQFGHFVGAVGERTVKAHLDAGPAVGVVAGRDHRHGGRIEVELREIGHRAERRADVAHPDAGLHQADDQRLFDRQRIVAVVVADGDLGLDAAAVHLRAEPEAERGHAGQVDLVRVFPPRVVFAEPGGRDHRVAQEFPGVRRRDGQGF